MIGVIDYKAGNAPSVLNALQKLNIPSSLVSTPGEIEKSSGIILPGVGSAQATTDSLKELNILEVLEYKITKDNTPFLGICIGLQILFEYSEEGNVKCLGWLPGYVKKFDTQKVRVPQIGWNEVKFRRKHPILTSVEASEFFYFVNSYYVKPDNENIILGTTVYDVEFCSMIAYKNIFATQFHTEKSGEVGLTLLRNFAALNQFYD
ncbi:MAG: imidazole glycerol phosphate synthase subunit HisH [Clostridiaceae bacterium]|jgi:glutamine amidotransferase|nr:imidazole glycerol phosphate synthase subunit HisH [Clostridiaceae bacterium]